MLQGSVIIPRDLCRLRPPRNTQINQQMQTGYRVISYPCWAGSAARHIRIQMHTNRSLLNPSWFQQKTNQENVICTGVTHHWPGQISHTSSEHLTGFLFIHSTWVSCWISLAPLVDITERALIWSTFTNSNCCIATLSSVLHWTTQSWWQNGFNH